MKRLLVGLVASVVVVGAAVAIVTPPPPARSAAAEAAGRSADGWQFDPIAALRRLHERMVAEGLPLIEVDVLAAVVQDRDVTLTLLPRRTVWVPSTAAPGPAAQLTVTVTNLPQAEAGYWRAAALPQPAYAVVAGRSLLGMAPLGGPDGDFAAEPESSGPMVMMWAAKRLLLPRYRPVTTTVLDHCGRVPTEPITSETSREALVEYLNRIGDVPENLRLTERDELDRRAQAVAAAAPARRDEVTGRLVQVSLNDVHEQLAEGIPPDQVRLVPTIPVDVNVAGVAPSAPDQPATQAAVFVDLASNEVLGWIPVVGTWSAEDNDPAVPDYTVEAQIEAPTPGADVGVLVRELDDERFDCPPDRGLARFAIRVPHDDIAGPRRAEIHLAAGSHRPLTP